MSKAFTDEESADASIAGRLPERAPPGQERPITPEGRQALAAELWRIATQLLPDAKAGGLATEAEVRRLEHRFALIEATLASVRVVKPVRDGRVRFGSRVTIAWEDGRTQVLVLVGPDEAEPREGRISVESPLARALLGRTAGDAIEFTRPRGTDEGAIEAVE